MKILKNKIYDYAVCPRCGRRCERCAFNCVIEDHKVNRVAGDFHCGFCDKFYYFWLDDLTWASNL